MSEEISNVYMKFRDELMKVAPIDEHTANSLAIFLLDFDLLDHDSINSRYGKDNDRSKQV